MCVKFKNKFDLREYFKFPKKLNLALQKYFFQDLFDIEESVKIMQILLYTLNSTFNSWQV